MFSLQVLGAVAQLERALISERTKAGIKAARTRGKLPGNPGLRERRPEALQKISAARDKTYRRPALINGHLAPNGQADAARSSLGRCPAGAQYEAPGEIVDGRASAACRPPPRQGASCRADLIERARRKPSEDRLMTLVVGISMANPEMTLRDIASQLEAMREHTSRGGRHWSPSSVKNLLDREKDWDW